MTDGDARVPEIAPLMVSTLEAAGDGTYGGAGSDSRRRRGQRFPLRPVVTLADVEKIHRPSTFGEIPENGELGGLGASH